MTTTPHRRPIPAPVMEPNGDSVTTGSSRRAAGRAFAVLRIAFGLTFLWAFVDKLFGLGYATKSGKGWIDGGDPTAGFLGKGASGPFESFYHSLVGDWWMPSPAMRPGRRVVTSWNSQPLPSGSLNGANEL